MNLLEQRRTQQRRELIENSVKAGLITQQDADDLLRSKSTKAWILSGIAQGLLNRVEILELCETYAIDIESERAFIHA